MHDYRSYSVKDKLLSTFCRVYTDLFENGKKRVQITMFLTHSLNYRRQRPLVARQRPLAAKKFFA